MSGLWKETKGWENNLKASLLASTLSREHIVFMSGIYIWGLTGIFYFSFLASAEDNEESHWNE